MNVAVLFAEPEGVYSGLMGVDVWDASRDARLYAGPDPVVAHPPCARWCRLAGLVEKRWGHKAGEDDGCFEAALAAVHLYSGVLEHPAFSKAWPAYGLPEPAPEGWRRGFCGGWSCHVEQGRYGHPAKKATWLYAFGTDLPTLRWGATPDQESEALVSWCGNKVKRNPGRPRLSSREASATPEEFRDILLGMARSAKRNQRRDR